MRHVLSSLFAAAAFAAPAYAADVAVPMDEVRIIAFRQPVSTVYMGNPAIADVTTIDAQHFFVLGKTFGETNMIALGRDGRPIANNHVTVFGRRMGVVTLNKGIQQFSYTCTAAHCEAAPAPGDLPDYHKAMHDEINNHSDMLQKAADASSGK